MSYMQCAKCGGMFGVIGNAVYTCGCVPPIDKNTQAAAAPTEEITCLLARAHMPAGAYWQQIHDIVQKWAARCANEARLEALEQAAKVAEGFDGIPPVSIAAAIRALKAAPLDPPGGQHEN